ncbi:Cold shock protein CspA [Mucinivorans hirudinis]|uniref:Cold shock protein CspA n=1 Tax=Mucinivorans hirudinis TaxID=1433126 RepID=A0A060RA70_9BACT|nr:Cold shock protein CspA [Mucinivorans hirudinis]
MAQRITTGKRDREKLKEQKRKEKQHRKEERQSGGVSTFEDMIAYVDENGMLCSKPPERSKREIDASEIAVSVPKQEDIEVVPLNGRVEHFNSSKGYGFVKDLGSSEKYFFHITAAPASITEGDKVTFELERGTRGMNAVRISILTNKQ